MKEGLVNTKKQGLTGYKISQPFWVANDGKFKSGFQEKIKIKYCQ